MFLRRRGTKQWVTKPFIVCGLESRYAVMPRLTKDIMPMRFQSSSLRGAGPPTNTVVAFPPPQAPVGTPLATVPIVLPTDGSDYPIPDLKAFLGETQTPQKQRFPLNSFSIYDTSERIVARQELRKKLQIGKGSKISQVSFRGLGGGGKSHNLMRFVAEQRGAGDCVAYIHDCDDILRANVHDVIANALITALTSVFSLSYPTLGNLLDDLKNWGLTKCAPWNVEQLTVQNLVGNVRKFVNDAGKRFLFVFDQENRITRVSAPLSASDWARQFITSADANLVVVSASDNNQGHEQRGWDTIIQLPTPMPSTFALSLLREAAGVQASFLPNSAERNLLQRTIGTPDGAFAPLEVGKVCKCLLQQRDSLQPMSIEAACRYALNEYYSEVFVLHFKFYDSSVATRSKTHSLITATSILLTSDWIKGAENLPEVLDRRFCHVQTTSANRIDIVFASPLVKRAMVRACLRQYIECQFTLNRVIPAFQGMWLEKRLFERFFSNENLMKVLFVDGSIAKSTTTSYRSSRHAFDMMKQDALDRGDKDETKVLLLRARGNYANIDGMLVSACEDWIDVYFLQCTVNPHHKDSFEYFFNHDFPTWVDMINGDATLSHVKFRFTFLWITTINPEKSTNAEEYAETSTTEAQERSWRLKLKDPITKDVTRQPTFTRLSPDEYPNRCQFNFRCNLSIHRPTRKKVYDRHPLRECHLYVDPDTLVES